MEKMLDISEVMKVLKHRYPFLLVDRVLECDAEHAVGLKNVTINEPFFQGHFPGEPVMPGVLIVEAMGQVGSIMATAQADKEKMKDQIVFLTGIDKTKLRKPVRPGDTLIMKARMLQRRSNVGRARIEAFVENELVAEAEYLFFVASTLQKGATKPPDVHPTAIVSPDAELASGVKIGAYCIIGDAKIGENTIIDPHAQVRSFVEMGADNHVHSCAVIGGEPQDHGYRGEKSFVKIGNGNTFREYVTVNRATGEGNATSIGDDCLLMEGVHVAHNVEIKNKVTIANKVGIAGFVQIDDFAVVGGILGIHQFVRIGKYCMIGGMSRVTKDVPPFTLAGSEPIRLLGLNVVGLRRGNFDAELRKKIASFYKKLYSGEKLFTESLKQARADFENESEKTPEISEIINFYENSKRGVTFWGGKKSVQEEEE